jgi:hypothetical protein
LSGVLCPHWYQQAPLCVLDGQTQSICPLWMIFLPHFNTTFENCVETGGVLSRDGIWGPNFRVSVRDWCKRYLCVSWIFLKRTETLSFINIIVARQHQ